MKSVTSPLTLTENTTLESVIETEKIVDLYKHQLNIDVSRFFDGLKNIYIYKCNETGYRFYYPFNIDGDSQFYEYLQTKEGYYPEWKWEHSKAFELIDSNFSILEIGCGEGSFLKYLKKNNINCIGLELNQNSVENGKLNGVEILNETIQDHAIINRDKYNFVCSFQVMEHISSIREIIESSLVTLKVGGTLIISVPNNDSFLGYDKEHTLNLPPHHMGLWNKNSLSSLEKIFPIKLEKILFEPPLEHHKYYYEKISKDLVSRKFQENRLNYGRFFGRIANYFFRTFYSYNMNKTYPNLGNFTIMAVYTKL